MTRLNGGISGKLNTSTRDIASGIWSLSEVQLARSNNLWPDLFSGSALRLDFDETTTLDSRISFTRATSATFFDKNGVLQTQTSGLPRFDHRLENGSWVNKGLLIEEQRTNLALQSENFETTWTNTNTTETINQTMSPAGTMTADAVFENTTNGNHVIEQIISVNMTTTHTFSCFIKSNGRLRGNIGLIVPLGSFQGFNATFNLSTQTFTFVQGFNGGTYVNSSITNVGNGWYRLSVSGFTGVNGSHSLRIFIYNDSGSTSYAGDVTKGFFAWGAQLEAGAFPTSYIATTSASVTRNADVASMTSTNFSSWYNQIEGTIFWRGDIIGSSAGSKRAFEFSNNTNNERLITTVENSSGNGFDSFVSTNNITQANLLTPDPPTPRTPFQTYKHLFAYKVDDFAVSLDGGSIVTDTSGNLPTVDRINLGSTPQGSVNFLNGHIAKFYYWNTRIPNEVLQNLTE